MNQETLKKAIQEFGAKNQLDMVIEECAELIQSINKCRRKELVNDFTIGNPTKEGDTETLFNLTAEIADVKIMIAQLELMLEPIYKEAVYISVERKLVRLEERISQNKYKSNN